MAAKIPNPHFTEGKLVWHRKDADKPWKQVQVRKVYANGNFVTYETGKQQWRCSPTGDTASQTGDEGLGYRWESIMASTPENDARVAKHNGPTALWHRWQVASGKVDAFSRRQSAGSRGRAITEAMVDALENVAKLLPKQERI
jgi:hypothetical protein